jgi:hypothetical protein
MTRTSTVAHACLASGGWLLPWLILLLVSASLATAVNFAVIRSVPASGAAVEEGFAAPPPPHMPYQPGSYCSITLQRSVCEADVERGEP